MRVGHTLIDDLAILRMADFQDVRFGGQFEFEVVLTQSLSMAINIWQQHCWKFERVKSTLALEHLLNLNIDDGGLPWLYVPEIH